MSVIVPDQQTARALNQLAREQMKLKLLTDIRTDLTICELEGWDQDYLHDLHMEIRSLCPCCKEVTA